MLIKYEELKTLIKDPVTGKLQQKSVFIVFSQGERLSAKILKICESFQVNIYQLPGNFLSIITLLFYVSITNYLETQADRARLSEQVNERIEILKILLDKGLKQRAQILEEIASQLIFWKNKVIREKVLIRAVEDDN